MPKNGNTACAFEGCGRPLYSRDLCGSHDRQRRLGKPMGAIRPRRSNGAAESWLAAALTLPPSDECIVWPLCVARGYGVMSGNRRAHRVAYEATHGPLAPGACVLHSCDNPPCVNPAHLRAGTQAENVADMVAKDRQAGRGQSGPRRRLTEDQVREAKSALAEGDTTARIAIRLGMSTHAIWAIKRKKAWAHVE